MPTTTLPPLNEENAPAGTPLNTYETSWSREMIEQYLARTGESLAAYTLDGRLRVPPVILLGCYARLIHETFFYETGVHTSSDLTLRRLPFEGETVRVSGAIGEYFEKNGNIYVRFSVVIRSLDGEPLAEVGHVSIYKFRPKHDRA